MEMTRRAMTENIMERTGDGPLANMIILGNLLTIHERKEEGRERKGKSLLQASEWVLYPKETGI